MAGALPSTFMAEPYAAWASARARRTIGQLHEDRGRQTSRPVCVGCGHLLKVLSFSRMGKENRPGRFRPDPSLVELPGIEPGSYGIPSRLLRAQSAMSLLGSPDHANKSGWRSQSLFDVPVGPA